MAFPERASKEFVNEEISITADTALRLGKALGTSAQLRLNLQNDLDMRTAKNRIRKALEKISPVTGREAA